MKGIVCSHAALCALLVYLAVSTSVEALPHALQGATLPIHSGSIPLHTAESCQRYPAAHKEGCATFSSEVHNDTCSAVGGIQKGTIV